MISKRVVIGIQGAQKIDIKLSDLSKVISLISHILISIRNLITQSYRNFNSCLANCVSSRKIAIVLESCMPLLSNIRVNWSTPRALRFMRPYNSYGFCPTTKFAKTVPWSPIKNFRSTNLKNFVFVFCLHSS